MIYEIWKGKQIAHAALLATQFTTEAKVSAMKK